jgi:NitT/TauT family transport system substrate-binding protein
VGLPALNASERILISIMAGYVGLDPEKDINWIADPDVGSKDRFLAGSIDAFLSFPPLTQELRADGIGHVVVSSAVDRPWSQYYCCLLCGNSDYVRNNPIATKRVVRALLKSTDVCFDQPTRAAALLVERGFTERYDLALETLQELNYGVWRDRDPADSGRFYALRMHELGMLSMTPSQAVEVMADWSFLKDVRRELKA